MMRKMMKLMVMAAVPGILPLTGYAQSGEPVRGWYAGGGIGYSNVRSVDSDGWFSDTSYGDPDFAYAITGGYRVMRFFAVEVSYADYGTPEFDDNFVELRDLGDVYDVDAEIDIDATQVSAVGILPFANGGVELYGRLGLAFWDAESEQVLVSRSGGGTIRRTIDEDGTDLVLGFGAALNFNQNWHVRLDVSSHPIDDELLALGKDDDAAIENVTVQVHYRFGDQW
jgi:opacity protein-like surface antigen